MNQQKDEWRTLRAEDIRLSRKADSNEVGRESEEHTAREAKSMKYTNSQNGSFITLDREQEVLEKGSVPF